MPRWTAEDIDWDAFDREKLDQDLLKLVKAASLTEYNAAQYTRYLHNIFQDDLEFAETLSEWQLEEEQHGRMLGRYARLADPDFDFDTAFKKFTDGYFKLWCEECAREEFAGSFITEDEFWSKYNGQVPDGKFLLNYRIPDAMLAELIRRPERYSVLLTTNDLGDLISDMIAEEIGGVGVAGGENIGDMVALYEPIHGTADDIAGKGISNPMSMLLSRTMMFHRWGWHEAAQLIIDGLRRTIADRTVTGDLASKMIRPKAKKVLNTKEFTAAVIANMKAIKNPKATATRVRKCRAVHGRCKCRVK